jgi:hypothetical protein
MKAWILGAAALALLAGSAQAAQVFAVSETTGVLKGFTAAPGLPQTHAFEPFGPGARNLSVGAFANGDGHTDLVVGSGGGGPAVVRVFNTLTGEKTGEFIPFAGYTGGVRVASGDVNGDGLADIIVGAGEGSSLVKVFEGGAMGFTETRAFEAFAGFAGGVSVALGENDDGRATLIVGAGAGGAPQVKVFDFETHDLLHSFFAFDPGFTGGVNVAYGRAGGLNTLITGQASGGGHINVFSLSRLGGLTDSFDAFGPAYVGGVNVGAGFITNNRDDGIIVGGLNTVLLLEANRQTVLANFLPFGPDGGPIAVAGTFDAVPEPAAWALMIAGFGLTGAAIRRRRAPSLP